LRPARGGSSLATLSLLALALSPAPAAACALAAGESVVVAGVNDARTLMLSDGRIVKLAAIEAPQPAAPGAPARPFAAEAHEGLAAIIAGRPLSLSYAGTRSDRHGRVLAFLMTGDDRSAQERLVEAGLARVAPTRDARLCVEPLLAAEARARGARRGIWRDPRYAVLQAGDLAALAKLEGRFALVEGTVASASSVGGRLYLNFGDDRRTDFTVTVAPADARLFKGGPWVRSKSNMPALAGRKLRMRGFLDRYNGPEMRLSVPEQVEFLDGGPQGQGVGGAHDDRKSKAERNPRP
jgi:endonuclease YncB( thermonuclease family)